MRKSLFLSVLCPLFLLLALPSFAALNATGYTSTGATIAADNGSWSVSSGTDANGNKYLILGSHYAYWNSTGAGGWIVGTTLGASTGTGTEYTNLNGSSAANFPVSGWSAFNGGSVPSFTANSATAPPSASFSASPLSVSPGGSSTLSWSSTNATSATIAAGSGAASSVGTSGSMTVSPSATTVYTLTATGSGGTATQQATVTVLAPTVSSMSVSPTSAPYGQSTSLTFTINLSSAAPSGGATITFTGAGAGGYAGGATLPPSFTIPYGSTSGTATGALQPSTAGGSYAFTASYGSSSASASVTVGSSSSTGSTGSTGTTSSTAAGAPGVSASLSPFVIASGGSSVLRWDTSGASSVTVTGVSNPSLSGTANVSPSATTTYTVAATNSAGTTTQTVTLQVGGAGAPGGDGVSTYTPGSGVTGLGAVTIAAPTVPAQTFSSGTTLSGITIPGLTIPGISIPSIAGGPGITVPGLTIPGLTIPGLTLPGYTMPALSVPGFSLPGISLPGDLKIGIPGIGSIGIPAGWLTQIIAAGVNPSTVGLGTLMQGVGYSNSLATYNAGAAVNQAVRDGTATLQQINSTSSAATQSGLNNVQAAVVNTASVVQGTIQEGTFRVQNTITTMEKTAVTDFQGMLTSLLQAMFIPDPSVLQQFQTQNAAFVNWGPVSLVNSFIATLKSPAGDGSLGGGLPGLTVPGFNVNPGDPYIQINADGSTKAVPAGVYATGVNVPMDMTPFTSSSSWPAVYKLETAFVTLSFIGAIWLIYWPRQVF